MSQYIWDVVVHLLRIMFLLFGALIGVRYRPVKYVHIAGLGYAIVMQVFGWPSYSAGSISQGKAARKRRHLYNCFRPEIVQKCNSQ